MAELLIYNKEHWMDALSSGDIEEYKKEYYNFQKKYDARYQRGDVVEVRPDGYWSKEHGWNKNVFSLVKLPEVAVSNVQHLMRSKQKYLGIDNDGKSLFETTRKREYKIDINADDIGKELEKELEDLVITKKEHPTVGTS